MKNVQALDINLRKTYLKVIRREEIERFEHLRYLKLKWGTFVGNLVDRLTELRWTFWSNPSLEFEPMNMHLKNVVVLEFSKNDFINYSILQSLIKVCGMLFFTLIF